jgi:FHA domain
VRDTPRVDVAAHYRHLIALGREAFLAAAAPAAFVRYPSPVIARLAAGVPGALLEGETLEVPLTGPSGEAMLDLDVFPLVKKPGASFPDRITIGRTPNNDIAIVDGSVSRFHAYVRQVSGGWVVADAGSKNGSSLRGARLEARREQPLPSKALLRLGEVELTFYVADDLYTALGGS